MTTASRDSTFQELRRLLAKSAADLIVADDSSTRFCLEANIGPATLQAWGGKRKRPTIPVAWVEHGTAYVSFHLMGIDGHPDVVAGMSDELRGRMQGKTCFNFAASDVRLFEELERVTHRVLTGMRAAGFIAK